MPRPPTQETRPRPTAIPTADAPLPPSTSQRKRDAQAFQALGVQLVTLSATQLARLDLPEALHEAVVAAQRMRSHGAHTRQMQLRLSRFMIYCASDTRRHHVWHMYSSRTCRTAPRNSWI